MPKKLIDLVVTRVDLVDEGANSEAFIKIFKRKEQEGGKSMTLEEVLKSLEKEQAAVIEDAIEKATGSDAILQEELNQAKQELEAAKTEVANLKKAKSKKEGEGEEEEDEILKNVSPEVKAIIQKAKLQAETAEQAVKKMIEKEVEQEAIAKAKEVEAVGASTEDLTELYKSLSKVDNKLADQVHDILKTAHTQLIESKAFEEVGKGGSGAANDADAAWAKIEKKAGEIAKKQNMTQEAAVQVVIEECPDLYKDYVRAQ